MGWNSPAGSGQWSGWRRLFNLHFCKFLILLVNASGNWKRTKCASDFHGFEHMQISTVECVLHGAEKCNIGEDFPDRAIWYTFPKYHFEESDFPALFRYLATSQNIADWGDIRGTVPFGSVTRLMCQVMRLHRLGGFIAPEFE